MKDTLKKDLARNAKEDMAEDVEKGRAKSGEENENAFRKPFLRDLNAIGRSLEAHRPELNVEEFGVITSVGEGISRIRGLPHVQSDELISFPGGKLGIAFNLDPEEVSVVMLD